MPSNPVKDFPSGAQAAFIVPLRTLGRVKLAWWAGSGWEDMTRALKVAARYEYDDGKLRVEDVGGVEYAIQIHRQQYAAGSEVDKQNCRRFGVEAMRAPFAQVYTVHLWDYTGRTSLYEDAFVATGSDPVPAAIVDAIDRACDRYRGGAVGCSDCGGDVDLSKPGGRYFAGVYCASCWGGETGQHKDRGGWQAVEARETYE